MRKTILATACAIWVTAGMPASADNLNLRNPEKAGLCALETAMAVLARMVQAYNCAQMEGSYDFDTDIYWDGSGLVAVDYEEGVRGLVLAVSPDDDNPINVGERWQVTGVGGNVGGNPVGPINGTCTNDAGGEIMTGTSVTAIDSGYTAEATFINRLYWDPNLAEPLGVVEKGQDVSSREGGWPRTLWEQKVKYQRGNGADGEIKMRKSPLVGPASARCSIRLRNAWTHDWGGSFGVHGVVRVR